MHVCITQLQQAPNLQLFWFCLDTTPHIHTHSLIILRPIIYNVFFICKCYRIFLKDKSLMLFFLKSIPVFVEKV